MQNPQFNTEKALIEKLKNQEWRLNNLYKIVNENGDLITFKMNRIQRQIYREIKEAPDKGRHINILKYRQGWVSTFFIILFLDDTLWWWTNRDNYIMCHRLDLLDQFFNKVKVAYDNLIPEIRSMLPQTKHYSGNRIQFEGTNNQLIITMDVRGKTPTNLHISEFAFMPEEHQAATFLAINPIRNANVSIESTANGEGNTHHKLCEQGMKKQWAYKFLFYPWFIDDRNELDAPEDMMFTVKEKDIVKTYLADIFTEEEIRRKMAWRRMQIETNKALGLLGEKKFMQENPANPMEAFLTTGGRVFPEEDIRFRIVEPLETAWEWRGWNLFGLPEDKCTIGIDVGHGIWQDYTVIYIMNSMNKCIALFRSNVLQEAAIAEKLDEILTFDFGEWRSYWWRILIENNQGQALINACKQYAWFDELVIPLMDTRTDEIKKKKPNSKIAYGFTTTGSAGGWWSKELIIKEFRGALYKWNVEIPQIVYTEIVTYRYLPSGKAEATPGNHDDCIIAAMLALYAKNHDTHVVYWSKWVWVWEITYLPNSPEAMRRDIEKTWAEKNVDNLEIPIQFEEESIC